MASKGFNLKINKKILPFKKTIDVDADKSISIRSFLIGAISHNISNAINVLESNDVLSTVIRLIKIGVKNPYDDNAPSIIRTGSGGDNVNGRLRLDETDCKSSGGKGGYKKLVLWVKTHKDHENKTFLMDNWQQWCDK